MTEQLFNVVWFAVAMMSFAIVLPRVKPQRRVHAALVLAAVTALLFPVISISDDLNVDWSSQEVVAVLSILTALFLALAAIARLTPAATQLVAFETVDLSDPRSPPRV
ncbi:MAG TPA: hypothetical protein VLU46_12485 [Thermoanaerobaculia bacterium]|nr:hypothetical protein [Thermoanaerobaculia bacterium]